jgi:hypothetical protein
MKYQIDREFNQISLKFVFFFPFEISTKDQKRSQTNKVERAEKGPAATQHYM